MKQAKTIKTKDLFKDFHYRDSEMDKLFPEEWEGEDLGEVICHNRTEFQTFLEMCEEFLGTKEPKELTKYSFTLPQVEKMVKDPKKYDLNVNGLANFFLVLNKEGSVSVVSVFRYGRQWYVYADPLEYDGVWRAGNRFFSRNLKLGNSETLTLGSKNREKQIESIESNLLLHTTPQDWSISRRELAVKILNDIEDKPVEYPNEQ